MQKSLRRWITFLLAAGLPLGLDQLAKALVTRELVMGQSWEPIPAISSLLRITRSMNTGAAFGIFGAGSDVILILAFVTVFIFIVTYPTLPVEARLSRIAIAMVSGGALSNAIDRLRFGHVVDYVDVRLSPTFSNISNLADHTIVIGVALLLIDQWRYEQESKKRAENIQEVEAVGYALSGAAPFDVAEDDEYTDNDI